jgi:hypothetical protein
MNDGMDRMFRYGCSIFFLLFVITKTNWRNSATAILGIYDVNNTTPFFSRIHLIQNNALYRERKKKRGNRTEQALMILVWRIKRYICPRDDRNVYISRTLSKYNITHKWYDARRILPCWYLIRMSCLSVQIVYFKPVFFHLIILERENNTNALCVRCACMCVFSLTPFYMQNKKKCIANWKKINRI